LQKSLIDYDIFRFNKETLASYNFLLHILNNMMNSINPIVNCAMCTTKEEEEFDLKKSVNLLYKYFSSLSPLSTASIIF